MQHTVDDLRRYVDAGYVAALSQARLHAAERAAPDVVDRLHREALKDQHTYAAAALALGLDPLVAHPTRQREVWDAIQAAGLSLKQQDAARRKRALETADAA